MTVTVELPPRTGEAISDINTALAAALEAIPAAVTEEIAEQVEVSATSGALFDAIQEGVGHISAAANAANAAQFWTVARSGANCAILFIGDSIGNSTDEWIYLGNLPWLAETFPLATIRYRTFDLTTGWGAYSSYQVGTSDQVISVDNASVSGAATRSFEGVVETRLFAEAISYQAVVVALATNYQTSPIITVRRAYNLLLGFVSRVRLIQSDAGLFLVLPSADLTADYSPPAIYKTYNMVAASLRVAAALNTGLVDIYSRYEALDNDASLYIDTVHPSALGTAEYVAGWQAAFAEPVAYTSPFPALPASPYLVRKPLLVSNCGFETWPDGQDAPTGWTIANATATKDAAKAGAGKYAVKLTVTGANASISRNLSSIMAAFAGREVVVAAEIWMPSTMSTALTGRQTLTATGTGGTVSDIQSAWIGLGQDGWVTSLVSLRVPMAPTAFSWSMYAGASDGTDIGLGMWIRSVTICEGGLPSPVADPLQSAGLIEDASGLAAPIALNPREAMNADGTPAAAGAGQMSVVMSGGPPPTALYLKGEDAQGDTQTDTAYWTVCLPADYRAGQDFTVNVHGEAVPGSGTLGTATVEVFVLASDGAGGLGSDKVGSAAVALATTNLLLYSGDFSNAAWVKTNITVTAGQADPFGGTDATKLEATATAGTNLYQQRTVADTKATAQVSLKKGSGATDGERVGLYNQSTTTTLLGGSVNLDTGVVTYTTGSSGIVVESLIGDDGSQWWDIGLFQSTGITSGDTIRFQVGYAGASETAGRYSYAYGAQLQAGDKKGPYVPTTSTALTSYIDDIPFTVDGTDLEPGDVIVVGVQTVIQETGGANPSYGRVNSVRLS